MRPQVLGTQRKTQTPLLISRERQCRVRKSTNFLPAHSIDIGPFRTRHLVIAKRFAFITLDLFLDL